MHEHNLSARLRSQPLSRRRALAGTFTGAAGLAALAAGCSSTTHKPATSPANGAAGPAGSPAAAQPKHGGTLVDGRFQILTGRTMDPDIETPTSNSARRHWYQGLLDYNISTLELVPELAQKWEQPDQASYLFHLQQGAKWHNKPPANGRAFTADDAVFGLNRVRTNDPKFTSASLLSSVDQISAVDPATMRLTTKHPDAVLLAKAASDGMLLMNPEVVAKAQKFVTPDEVVGTGAFILKSLQDEVGADSVRNPDYWKAGLPYLDGHSYKYFGDPQQQYAALLAKQLDMAQLPGQQKDDYISRKGKGYVPKFAKLKIVNANWEMPNVKAKPFNDPRLTRAMRLLTDYQELRDAHGKAWLADAEYGSVLPTALDKWDFTPDEYAKLIFWQQPKDAAVKQALDLLSAAGYSKDKPFSFEFAIHVNAGDQQAPAMAQLIQAEWKKYSQGVVDAQIKILDGAQSTKARVTGQFSYSLDSDAGAIADPDAWFDIFHTGGSRNYSGFSDPEVDGLIDKQGQLLDAAQRQTTVKQIVQLLIDRSPMVMPYRGFGLDGEGARIHGHDTEGDVPLAQQYEHVWLDA